MNSFISHFKPWILALAAIALIEGAFYAVVHPPRLTWNSFLEMQMGKDETVQRLVAYDKICALGERKADIIQVGDSSGMHGVMPKVVMASLPGYTYLNCGVATNLGYPGYLKMAEIALRENPDARYLVVYTCMIGAVPRRWLWHDTETLMSDSIENEFLRPTRHLIQFPSLQARTDILGFTYYLDYIVRPKEGLFTNNRGYYAFNSIYKKSLGWTRETDVEGDVPNNVFSYLRKDGTVPEDEPAALAGLRLAPRVTDEHFFDWWTLSEKSYFDVVYDAFAKLAKDKNVKLILVFNPMPEEIKLPIFDNLMDWEGIRKGLERVKQRHPEVTVTGFDFWPSQRFSVFSHIATPYAVHTSQRVADLLKPILPPRNIENNPPNAVQPSQESPLFSVNFEKPYAGYGFVNYLKETSEFPMSFMRGRECYIFADVPPTDQPMQLKVTFDRTTSPDKYSQLGADCNGTKLTQASQQQGPQTITWDLPASCSQKYLGWMVVKFDRAESPDMISFSQLEIGLAKPKMSP